MKRALLTALVLSLAPATAQTAAELLTVTAISSTLDSTLSVRVPSGTSFVSNPSYARTLGPKLLGSEAGKYGDLQLFTARGYAATLATVYISNLTSNFAASGLFEQGRRTVRVGNESWTRTDFMSDEGRKAALFVTKRADGVYFLTAVGR